jgi:putative membrane protein
MSDQIRKPRAIHLDAVRTAAPEEEDGKAAARKPRSVKDLPLLVPVPDEAANAELEALTPPVTPSSGRRIFSWGGLLVAMIGGLVSLAAGLAVDRLIEDLFARNTWLGWFAALLAALAVIAALAIVLRETFAIMRLRAVEKLRVRSLAAHEADDQKLARGVIADLAALYSTRPETAHGRKALSAHAGEIIDGSDLIALAERDLLAPLDRRARTMVLESAKRVSIVTAVSPRALVDLAFVLMENMRLIRRLSELYGGRPGTLGFWRLARNVIGHLAATGAIAVGDGVMQQLIGHGLAARLSARLGEGVVNGLLTARIGIAAIDVCRPVPFINERRPGVSDFFGELAKIDGMQKTPRNESLDASGRDAVTGRNMK